MDQPPPLADQPVAGDVYAVELAAYTGRKAVRRLALAVWMLVSNVLTGDVGGPSVGQVVVRHRGDGRAVMRLDAGGEEEAAGLVSHVREQLTTLSPEEFCERWNLDPDA
jgi:hypothetical protein